MAYGASNLVIHRSWCVAFISAKTSIQDQGTFEISLMALLPTTKAETLICNVIALFVGLIDNIPYIIMKCDCNNNANNVDISKILLHNLYVLLIFLLCISIHWHKLQLE